MGFDHNEQQILDADLVASSRPTTVMEVRAFLEQLGTDERFKALTQLTEGYREFLQNLLEILDVKMEAARDDFIKRKEALVELQKAENRPCGPSTVEAWKKEVNELRIIWTNHASFVKEQPTELADRLTNAAALAKDLRRLRERVTKVWTRFDKLLDKHIRFAADHRPKIEDLDRFVLANEQEKLVTWDYDGEARLVGPAGSGKTIVLLQRALRLACENPNHNVRIFTINRSLAGELQDSLHRLPGGSAKNIHIQSFHDFLARILLDSGKLTKSQLRVDDKKSKEGIANSESWSDFAENELMKCKRAGLDLLLGLSKRLGEKAGKAYLYEEIHYIQSAVPNECRSEYLKLPRKCRRIPMQEDDRIWALEVLAAWEEWLEKGSLSDPESWAGTAAHLFDNSRTVRGIQREFPADFVLIDEEQDFGTVELCIVMKYLQDKPSKNRLFLTGDLRQKVFAKHHDTRAAGMNFQGKSRKLDQTYRCTQQILRAAHEIAIHFGVDTDDDVEVVDPKLSRFEGALPQVIGVSHEGHVDRLEQLVGELRIQFPSDRIAIVTEDEALRVKIQNRLRWPNVLRNEDPQHTAERTQVKTDNVVSRMNAVKGFEFDTVIVANLSTSQLPRIASNEDEWWRDGALVYTALTRARTRLYITFEERPSPFLAVMREHVDWIDRPPV
ncbi:MAG: UvrD-helicase domain-containing protein [Planctomycetaceae bacterium]|nr:UvrD-helicase domain-containing protein [Planctomycetaceae bacterium]MCB9952117.1 UvrD-helicase domain-containing protein [Planctomycetaceae bacterium]